MAADTDSALAVYFEVVSAARVPQADRLSPSDPYVEMQLVLLDTVPGASGRMAVSSTARTPTIVDCADPVWFAPLALRLVDDSVAAAQLGAQLRLWDRDVKESADDLLGELTVPLVHLPVDVDVDVVLTPQRRFAKLPAATVRLCRRSAPPGLIVEVERLANCPKLDVLSESDPYCRLRLTDGQGRQQKGRTLTTCVKTDSKHASFRELCAFYAYARPDDLLCVDVFDADDVTPDDVVGRLHVTVAQLHQCPAGAALACDVTGAPGCTLQLRLVPGLRYACAARRRLYFVRHGESEWNAAMERRDLGKLYANDHPLSAAGLAQARALNASWRADSSPAAAEFVAAQHCFSSPLTRALQTCLVALHGHPLLSVGGGGVRLLATAREVKTLVGLDTVGVAFGRQAIVERARLAAAAHLPPDLAAAYFADDLVVDAYQCESQWWSDSKESLSAVHQRFDSFLNTLLFYPAFAAHAAALPAHAAAVVVGHSLFFRYLCRRHIAPDRPDLAPFAKRKLANASCVAVDIDWNMFDTADQPVIRAIELLFNSTLEDDPREDPSE